MHLLQLNLRKVYTERNIVFKEPYRKGYEFQCNNRNDPHAVYTPMTRSDAEKACGQSKACLGLYDNSAGCTGGKNYQVCIAWRPLHQPENGVDNSGFTHGCAHYKGTKSK